MKKIFTALFLTAIAFCMMLAESGVLFAQDTLDVAQGYETLNLAVEGDTLPGGIPANPNRVYRLERGGFYLLNGTIRGRNIPLRIVAAKGDGPKPVLIATAGQTGSSLRYFRPASDAEWRGLYLSGIDNLGNQVESNAFRCDKKNGRFIIDDCYVDGDAQAMVRMNAEGQKLYITNTIFANSFLLSDPNNGRFIDTRGNTQDTIFIQNSTFYNSSTDPVRSGGGIIKNFLMDHCTLVMTAGNSGEFDVDRAINCLFTNNLMLDFGYEGRDLWSVDSTGEVAVPIDSLKAPNLATDDQRTYTIKNNVMGWSPQVKAWIQSKDSLDFYRFIDATAERFIATFPNMVAENNIYEDVVFSDGPETDKLLAYMEHRFNDNYANNNNPDFRVDRNGVGTLTDNPQTFGPPADDYNFDYAATFAAYTHAMGGFPAGDLNWFPAKKAEWETWVTKVEFGKKVHPTEFYLAQNYPNPFNPTTSIPYSLNKRGAVTLSIYNVLGQKVRTLVNQNQDAGSYVAKWDGRNDAGIMVPSGTYIYRLETNDRVLARKMLLMK
ncbi:MAG: T9SS type A sorting domain-containing protein [candidate division KSB1 bacterium]|nr:T9SS type A sorting domain-containing protein [candidate division KSB1 bacterium]